MWSDLQAASHHLGGQAGGPPLYETGGGFWSLVSGAESSAAGGEDQMGHWFLALRGLSELAPLFQRLSDARLLVGHDAGFRHHEPAGLLHLLLAQQRHQRRPALILVLST